MNNFQKNFLVTFFLISSLIFFQKRLSAKSINLQSLHHYQAHTSIKKEYRSFGLLAVEFIGFNKRLITSGADGYVKIWSQNEGESHITIDVNGPEQPNESQDWIGGRYGRSLVVDENNDYFVVGVGNNPSKIQKRDLQNGQLIRKYKSPGDIDDLEILDGTDQAIQPYTEGGLIGPWAYFIPGMRELYAGFIRFEIDTGDILGKGIYHSDDAQTVAISGDKKYAVTGAEDDGVILWKTQTGNRKWVRYHESGEYRKLVSDVAFGANSKKVFSIGNDHRIRAWSVRSGDSLWSTQFRLTEIVVDPKGRFIAGTNSHKDERNFVAFFEPETGQVINITENLHAASIEVIEISEDGSKLITGAVDGSVGIWNISLN